MKIVWIISILCFGAVSCEDDAKGTFSEKGQSRKQLYENKMRKKKFKFYQVGDCQKDYDDNLKNGTIYLDWQMNSKNGKVIQFNILENCGSEFMGDYQTLNDTLYISLENISTTIKMCNCLFVYRMELSTGDQEFREIIFTEPIE